jgi:hypothetical protein
MSNDVMPNGAPGLFGPVRIQGGLAGIANLLGNLLFIAEL